MFISINNSSFEERKKNKIAINQKIKKMSNRILQVRVYNDKDAPNFENINKEYFNIRVLSNLEDYNFETGIEIKGFSILWKTHLIKVILEIINDADLKFFKRLLTNQKVRHLPLYLYLRRAEAPGVRPKSCLH